MNVIFSEAVLNGVTRRINESSMRVSPGFEYKLKKLFYYSTYITCVSSLFRIMAKERRLLHV